MEETPRSVNSPERQPLLTPTASLYTHSRSASYGTYLPQFNTLDINQLRRLLPSPDDSQQGETPPFPSPLSPTQTKTAKEEPRALEESFYTQTQGAESHPPQKAESKSPKRKSSLSPLPSVLPPLSLRGHRHKDSVIETDLYTDLAFLHETENQLLSLYDYISFHLKTINSSIDMFKTTTNTTNTNRNNITENTMTTTNHRSSSISSNDSDFLIISQDMEDKSSINSNYIENNSDSGSIGGDSGIEDDHLTSPRGFLTRVREVIESLRTSLETTVRQLDEMVGIYDQRTEGNLGSTTLSKHNTKRLSLQEQITSSLERIDNELSELNKKEVQDDTIATVSNKARKEGLGCNGSLAFLLLLFTISVLSYFGGSHPEGHWVIALRLLRSPLTIVLFMFLFGFNVIVWSRHNIDYIRMFEFPLSAIPTPKLIFNMAAVFTLLFTSLSAICFISDWFGVLVFTDKTIALLMWVIFVLFLVNPFKMFYRKGRYAFILVIVRILMAPFPIVKFGDFWLADQFNSMVALFLDVQYTLCFCGSPVAWNQNHDGSVPLKACTLSNLGIRPIVSCLPALWRMLQCIRCYQKTRKIAHLINAVKYFTTFPVVVFSLVFAMKINSISLTYKQLIANIDDYGWIVIMWSISSLVHALYCFFWDIKMDWGLFCFSQRTLLRPRLFYPRWIYYIAIVFDFIVRFACAIKLTLAIVYHIDLDIVYFGLVIAEILRRWVWNFFRIEYEQILRSSKL